MRFNRMRLFAIGAAVALLAACQSYVFEPVVPALIAVNNTTYQLDDVVSADILFVVDDSGSMAGEQKTLADNFGIFINAIQSENDARAARGDTPVDYQIAVASTSLNLKFETGAGDVVDRTVYGTDANCQTPYTITAGSPYPEGKFMAVPGNDTILKSSKLSSAQIIDQFTQNVKLGVCGSGQEQGLLAARRALEANPGFVRPKSKLVVVFLSDEEDCSDPNRDLLLSSAEDRCVAESGKPNGGLLGPVSDYAKFLKGLSNSVTIGSIVSASGTTPDVLPAICRNQACETSCTSGGDPRGPPCYCGGMSPGSRYLAMADLVNGSLKDSICQDSFSDTLQRLAEVIVTVDVIYLNSRPFNDDPSLVLLKIARGDQEILCGSPSASLKADPTQSCASNPTLDWEYDATDVSIRLCDNPSSSCKIQPGDAYKVSFVERACSADHPC